MLRQACISQVPDHRIHWNTSIELDTQIIPPLRKLQLSPPQPLFQFRHLFGNCLQQDYEDATERWRMVNCNRFLPGKEISGSKDITSSLPVKPVLGTQLASGWSDDTNRGSWRLAWSHGWGLWPRQGCAGPRCCGTEVTQELVEIHVWLLGLSTVTAGLAISAYLWDCGYHLPVCALPLLLFHYYKTKHCSSCFFPAPLLVWLIHQSPLHFMFAISVGTACRSHASHTNDTGNHENISMFKDCHNCSLDTGILPFPTLLAA